MSKNPFEVGKFYQEEVTPRDIEKGNACSHKTCPGHIAILRGLTKKFGKQDFDLSVRPHTIKFSIPSLRITVVMQPQSLDGSKIQRLDYLYNALEKTGLYTKRECQALAKKAMKPFRLRARIESVKKMRGKITMTEEAKEQLAQNKIRRQELGLKNARLNIGRSISV